MSARVRHLASVNPPIPGWENIPDESPLTFVPLEAVWPRRVDFSRVRPKRETSKGYSRFMEGDVIVPKITPTFEGARSSWISGSPTPVLTGTTELHIIRTGPALNPRYLDYLFSSLPFLQEGTSQMIGVAGQKRVPDSFIRNYPVPISDLRIQLEIADFLDNETAHIDTLIDKKQRLLELVSERRQLVGEEVVKDLRERVRSVRLKYLVTESDERWGTRSEPTLLSVSIHHGVVPRESVVERVSRSTEYSSYKLCQPGDIAINRMRAFQGGVGIVGQRGIVSPDYTVLKVDSEVLADYLHFLMRSHWFVAEMTRRLRGIGSTDQGNVRTPRINFADLGKIRIPVPELDEQESVSRRLAEQDACLAKAAHALEAQLDLLGERRRAVITAAVAGAFDISGSAA